MKRSQIVLFSIVLLVTGLIYIRLVSNREEEEKETKEKDKYTYVPISEVKNEMRSQPLVSYGQISPNVELIISFEVQGKLLKGNQHLKPGVRFSRDELLYLVDNNEALYSFNSQRAALSQMIVSAMPDIDLDYPTEQGKWLDFLSDLIHYEKRLPALPEFKSSRELMFMTSRNVHAQYYALKSQEERISKYFYRAPFNGTVIATFAEPGSIINPGMQVARIAKSGDLEAKVPISLEDLPAYREKSSATFTDARGRTVGTGKIVRVSDVINAQTQSADVFYSVRPNEDVDVYNGMYVNVSIEKMGSKKKSTAIPKSAFHNGSVHLLEGSTLVSRNVISVSSSQDSLYVTGLNDGEILVLESLTPDEKKTYRGIKR